MLVCTLVSPHVRGLPKEDSEGGRPTLPAQQKNRHALTTICPRALTESCDSAVQSPEHKKARRRAYQVEIDLTPVLRRFGR